MWTLWGRHRSEGRPVDDVEAIRRRSSGARTAVILGGGILLALVSISAGYVIVQSHNTALNRSMQELAALDVLLVKETERSMLAVRLAVDGVAERKELDTLDLETIAAGDNARLGEMLADKATTLEQLGALLIVDQGGRVVAASNGQMTGVRLNAAYYDSLVQNPGQDYFVSPPLQNPLSKELSIGFARRLGGADNGFIGAVIGLLDLSYFEEMQQSMQLRFNGSIGLWHSDGTLLARFPPTKDIGRRFHLNGEFPQQVRMSEGARYVGDDNATSRIVASKHLEDYPLAMSVTYDADKALQEWRSNAFVIGIGAALIVLLGVVLLFIYSRRIRAYELMDEAIAGRHLAILQREAVEDQLRQAQKLETIGQLTAGIAHDFNNLLTVVIGNLELISLRLPPAKEGRRATIEFIERATMAARKAATLTHRLLAFARKQALAPEHIDSIELLEAMREMLGRTFGEQILIVTDLKPDTWQVFADKTQTESVILNLAVNSRDAMPEGGKLTLSTGNVVFSGDDDTGLTGEFVAIRVSDTGVGMSKEVLARAFEPFFSTKEFGKGSGLGLSQVYGFAKQSGGDVTIESAPNAGTTATIYLPKSPPSEAGADVADVRTEIVHGAGERVLVVEDSDDVRDFAVEALTSIGYKVVEADSGDAALDILRRQKVDCMLTDIGLPGMDGQTLVQRAREIVPGIPVVYMTGYAPNDIFDRSGLPTDAPVVTKPFSQAVISVRLAEVMVSLPERMDL